MSKLETEKTGVLNAGAYSERATPVPIPNTEVKPFSADDTSIYGGKVGRRQRLEHQNQPVDFL